LKSATTAHEPGVQFEPGLDRHEWESRWAVLEDDARTDPEEALPELADLVEEMLVEAGYDVTDPVARAGEEREVVAEYLAARETANRVNADEDVDPGDVAAAINGLVAIRDYIIEGDGGA
jgi:hypothetical protein